MGPSCGGDEGNRTPDPLLAKQVLSQLSYTPICLRALVFCFQSTFAGTFKIEQCNYECFHLSGYALEAELGVFTLKSFALFFSP